MEKQFLRCLADCHTHSKYSFDGRENIDDMCEAAINKGLNILTITDHCDIDDIIEGRYPEYDAEKADTEIRAAQKKYKKNLLLLRGIELGQAIYYPSEASEFLERYNYDFVLGSMHNLLHAPDFSQFKWADMTETEMAYFFEMSLDEIKRVIEFPGMNSASHINYPVRYIRRAGKNIDYDRFLPKISEIYKIIIEKEMSLECNTSGWHKQPVPDDYNMRTLPDTALLKLYYDLGGRMITIGSDAHNSGCIGVGIRESLAMLKNIGFDCITVYIGGKSNMIPIEI